MQISLKWVNELVTIELIDLDYLITKLTLGGFEVEEILEVEIGNQKTITLDISATANRSDSLSIQGLSLEIAALLNQPPKISSYAIKSFGWSEQISNFPITAISNFESSGFISITVENLTNLVSPKWLKEKLIASGITPENNLKDFQNYILLETGYPFEFYDLTKLYSKLSDSKFELHLGYDKDLKKFSASNGIDYELDDSILILKANKFPISIAGIISNEEVSYSKETTSLLIEGSIFNASKIRQQSRKLGLRTDRSSRYEKSLKNVNLLESFYRLISLLRIQNPNLICKLHTVAQPLKEKSRIISLDYKNIQKVLGPLSKTINSKDKYDSKIEYTYISPNTVTESLERLQFQVKYDKTKTLWEVVIPLLRNDDIVLEVDIIEEIGRLYGFDNFLTRLPGIKKIGTEDFSYQARKKMTFCLINLGLNELIQYSLVNQETYFVNEIKLINPLVQDYSNLRSSLLPNLVKAVEENIKKGNPVFEGFEYGHVFSGNPREVVKEREHVAGVFGGNKIKSSWSSQSKVLNWFEAKGYIEQIFQKLNLVVYWKSYKPIQEKDILHPYRTAKLHLNNGTCFGVFGQIHPILSKRLDISTNLYFFEFDFEVIKNQIQDNKLAVYQDYSLYPKIIKDLSFIIKNDIRFESLEKTLYLNGTRFLTDIKLLDTYRGISIPEGHTSLCLQFVFQSEKQTLQNKKVEMIIENLKFILKTKFNATIRI